MTREEERIKILIFNERICLRLGGIEDRDNEGVDQPLMRKATGPFVIAKTLLICEA